MTLRGIFLFLSLCCFGTSLIAQSRVTNQNLFDTIPFIPEHGAKRLELFAKEAVTTGKIMFLGNSITEMGDWRKLLNDNTVVNRGIGGDITFSMLKRLDDVVRRKPSKLFILIGINDIGKDIPDAVIADNYRKIITRIQKESPDTKIYVQSILPVNSTYTNFPQHYDKLDHVIRTNKLVRETTDACKVRFINLFPLFLDDQERLDKKYTVDGLHLNGEGYQLWVNYLRDLKLVD